MNKNKTSNFVAPQTNTEQRVAFSRLPSAGLCRLCIGIVRQEIRMKIGQFSKLNSGAPRLGKQITDKIRFFPTSLSQDLKHDCRGFYHKL